MHPTGALFFMTISELREWAIAQQLPLSEFLMLMAHVLGCSKEDLFIDSREVAPNHVDSFKELVGKRLSGVPMAYLRNKKEFYGSTFYVDERVLIPRPETELIVDTVLDLVKSDSGTLSHSPQLTIADVGTGSGALALTLARVIQNSRVHAVDISSDVLLVAEKNRALHGLDDRVSLHCGDLLTPLILKKISPDILVANLPYISLHDVRNVAPDVHAHEPHLALYSGESGLEHYERMFAQLSLLPRLPKYILGEFGAGQVDNLKLLIQRFPSITSTPSNISIFSDLAGIPRVFLISLPR